VLQAGANSVTVSSTAGTAVAGALSVAGATTTAGLANTGNISNTGAVSTATLSTSGAAGVGGALTVAGATTTAGITNTGDIKTGTLTTTGNASVGGALSVAGNAAIAGSATIGGALKVGGIISGVANGVALNDAINVGQLAEVKRELSRGIAGSAALAGIPQVDPGKAFSLGAGAGSYGGESAIAVGFSARFKENVVIKAAIGGTSGGKAVGSAGVGFSW
jgi:hypothetical protein